jgi:hypothetical protein
MPDIEDQLRTYYEATTEPIDVDAITVDPGAVLVGPFPDAAQRRSAKQTVAPEKPPTSRAWRGVAAAAAALIVAIAGVALVLAGGGGNVEPAAPPTVRPSDSTQITAEEALVVVDRYWTAYDAGDFHTVAGLFTADAVTEGLFSRSEFFAWLEQYRAWSNAQGSTQTARECKIAERGAGTAIFVGTVGVTCSFEDLPVLHDAVGAPPVRISIGMEVGVDGIQGFWITPWAPNYDSVSRPFQQWIEEHHPDDAPAADWAIPITHSTSVEEAERFGRIRTEYAEEWAAYMEANGCTFNDWGC